MPPKPRKKEFWSRISRELRRAERRVLVGWVRFAKQHRHSNRLPFVLFLLMFIDGFVLIIPSMLIMVAATTISPKRWWFFSFIFVVAVTLNNLLTYYIGRSIPVDQIIYWLKFASVEELWFSAKEAIQSYGKYATFLGALIGLPTQVITMIVGAADRQVGVLGAPIHTSMEAALGYGALGHALKIFVLCGLVRYGWVRLERKIEKTERTKVS